MRQIGSYSDANSPQVEVVIAPGLSNSSVNALIDTGYTGFVLIPPGDARDLLLVSERSADAKIANGEEVTTQYSRGEVEIDGRSYSGEISWIEDSIDSDVLIGCKLLDAANVVIDYEKNEIRVP